MRCIPKPEPRLALIALGGLKTLQASDSVRIITYDIENVADDEKVVRSMLTNEDEELHWIDV